VFTSCIATHVLEKTAAGNSHGIVTSEICKLRRQNKYMIHATRALGINYKRSADAHMHPASLTTAADNRSPKTPIQTEE
jgi:hypothetical protein